jgi:hypothetical protein
MKERITKLAGILIVAAFLLGMIPMNVTAKNADSMWIEGTTTFNTDTMHLNDKFNVTVWMNITQANVFGAQVALLYNRTQLKATRSDFTTGTNQFFYGHEVATTGPTIDTSFLGNGSVLAFESCKGSDFIPVPKVGSLIWIEFQIIKVPGKGQTLTSKIDISTKTPDKNWVQDPGGLQLLDVAYDATYSYAWKEPSTHPYLAVDPTLKTFGPDPPSAIGASWDEKVYIKGLDGAWGITNASFTLSYNTTLIDVLGGSANVTINTADWDGAHSEIVTHSTPYDTIDIVVRTTKGLAGDVLIATIKFTVMHQLGSPPAPPYPWAEISPLTLSTIVLWDHTLEITTTDPTNGQVKIYALRTLPLPWFEVKPKLVEMGPEPAVCKTFDVDIVVKDLDKAWYAVLCQFRVLFDNTLVMGVGDGAKEGPFFQDPTWNTHGTMFQSFVEEDPIWGWNVVVVDMLLPNKTGDYDQTVFPNCDNTTGAVIATLTFHVESQRKSPCNFTGDFQEANFTVIAFWRDGDSAFVNKDGEYVPTAFEKYVNGKYRIYDTPSTGRFIDLYGGAYNAGYGAYPFPAPYGGQGLNMPMDLVIPQSEVKFFAKVEYNCWPVQSKDVSFEIEGPFYKNESNPEQLLPKESYKIWAKLVARTNSIGIAVIVFRMPWPCEDPENITGIWKVTATVNLADVIITDTLAFYYEYLVDIFKVTTDKFYYYHDDYVHVCVEYRTHALQTYPALFAIVITDELGVPFGMDAEFNTTIPAAKRPIDDWCTWKENKFCVYIYIPKWAFSGYAYIHVSVYDKDPTEGGFAWAPEYAPLPQIYILPVTPPTVYIDPLKATMNMTAGETATFTAIPSGGWPVYTYQWYGDGYPLGTAQTQTIYSWSPGTHVIKVVVTDFYGYTAIAFATLIVVV